MPLAGWFVCECGAVGCLGLVHMSAAQFDAWRDAHEPLLAPGHVVETAAPVGGEAEISARGLGEALRNERGRRDLADLSDAVRRSSSCRPDADRGDPRTRADGGVHRPGRRKCVRWSRCGPH